MADKQIIYWDTCIFLAWLKSEEDKGPEVLAGIDEIVGLLDKNQIILNTSALTSAEILKSTLTSAQIDMLERVLHRRNVEVVQTSAVIWNRTHDIRDYYLGRGDGLKTLSLPDSVHLATAIIQKVDIFYTTDEFDELSKKKRALIPLNHDVAGYDLAIQKPLKNQLGLNLIVREDEDAGQEAEE